MSAGRLPHSWQLRAVDGIITLEVFGVAGRVMRFVPAGHGMTSAAELFAVIVTAFAMVVAAATLVFGKQRPSSWRVLVTVEVFLVAMCLARAVTEPGALLALPLPLACLGLLGSPTIRAKFAETPA